METIEEIGHKAYNEAFNNDWGRDIAEFARLYAEFGATEQKAIDDNHLREVTKMVIDKACEWLDVHLWDYFISSCEADDCGIDDEKLLDDFRKAMEE